ncbi:long-chain fatty acid--CoA ligase [Streptomyces diacarni]|uniref:Long-chain fatty acid--CoA ligase n=1 Tax=Streptomyces diacarni TaxID=2800381 RepID=A0A367ETB6_9ACTN|nr:long-chain fatty acid--CoA ligase [Streptomyces diacarni]
MGRRAGPGPARGHRLPGAGAQRAGRRRTSGAPAARALADDAHRRARRAAERAGRTGGAARARPHRAGAARRLLAAVRRRPGATAAAARPVGPVGDAARDRRRPPVGGRDSPRPSGAAGTGHRRGRGTLPRRGRGPAACGDEHRVGGALRRGGADGSAGRHRPRATGRRPALDRRRPPRRVRASARPVGVPVTTASAVWTSNAGVPVRDLVPASLRRAWVERGWCPDRDVYALFSAHVRAHPRRAAVVDASGTVDYAGLDATVRHFAARLAEHGLGPGDLIALRLPNGRAAVAAELAVAAVGAVALPYPPGHGSLGPAGLLARSRARALVVARERDAVPSAGLPYLETLFTCGEAGEGPRCAESLTDAARTDFRPRTHDPEAPVRLLVSSGSEAEPKMVAYSHNAMAGGRASYVRALHDGTEPMRNLLLVSLASSFGSLGSYVTLAALGGTMLLQDGFDAAAALRMLIAHRPTHVFGVPAMLRRLADLPRMPGEDVAGLRALVSSGAALPGATAEACRARFGRRVLTVYGSSDGVNCHTSCGDGGGPTCAGTPDPAVAEIRVAEPGGSALSLPAGRSGEILARGPMTPLSHVAGPDQDARYRTDDGWVRTGDLGRLDAEGRLHVLGRLKQIVVRGGYNISPAEVERELGGHPAVAEVACVGVPDPELGERLCACVRQAPCARPAPLTLAALTSYLEDERGLERRKLPERLLLVEHMPLGPTGKVCRTTLAGTAAASSTGRAEPAAHAPVSP